MWFDAGYSPKSLFFFLFFDKFFAYFSTFILSSHYSD